MKNEKWEQGSPKVPSAISKVEGRGSRVEGRKKAISNQLGKAK
jgi:hypothetical protein